MEKVEAQKEQEEEQEEEEEDFDDVRYPEPEPSVSPPAPEPGTDDDDAMQQDEPGDGEQEDKEEEEEEEEEEAVDTTRPLVVSEWLEVVRFGSCAWRRRADGGAVRGVVSAVCRGTLWPCGWESHRLFANPCFPAPLAGVRPSASLPSAGTAGAAAAPEPPPVPVRTHVCSVAQDGRGEPVFCIRVDGEALAAPTPERLMARFRARFAAHAPVRGLARAWLQSCEHFFGLVAVDAAVRAMPGHAAALAALQRGAPALPTVRMPPLPPLLPRAEVVVPRVPWTRRAPSSSSSSSSLQTLRSRGGEDDDGDGGDDGSSTGSATESDTETLYADAAAAARAAYAHMSEARARTLLRTRTDEAARLRALLARADTVLRALCAANSQWLLLEHLRVDHALAQHTAASPVPAPLPPQTTTAPAGDGKSDGDGGGGGTAAAVFPA